jgi:chemotaxis protein methyltransferase CheR
MSSSELEVLEIKLLLEAIHARYGVDLRGYAPASMRRRVLAALERSGLSHLGELQHALLHSQALFAHVLEDLTVKVSDLFRDPPFYRAFRELIIPTLRTYPFARIWHAGCSTGEEVYATSILLHEAGLAERVQLYATDLSAQALELARQGTYSEEVLEAATQRYRDSGGQADFADYYTAAYDGIAMRDFLRRHVLFFQHDLVTDHVFGEMHVILCRNVLIYFGRELRERVLDKLTQSLRPGGFLCLGSSERLSASAFAPRGERIYEYLG